MPWSSKAQDLLRQQYAPAGAAARAGLAASIAALRTTSKHVPDASEVTGRYEERRVMAEQYVEAYRRYCWTVHSLADLKLAPFHLLASEGVVHADKDHVWHMTMLARLRECDPRILLATPYKVVDLTDEMSDKRDSVVGGTNGFRRRGHGSEADPVRGKEPTRSSTASSEMPRS